MTEREIFTAALHQPAGPAREVYLDAACAGDSALRERVKSLLSQHEQLGSFMELPSAVATIDQPPSERLGSQIGPYKLLQQIGEGGFGVVYMAEQTEPVRRKVALKLIKPGMDTRQVIARFEAERQALAVMDHSNIAKVLDAGTTGERRDVSLPVDRRADAGPLAGRPYFVMELVRGIPITQYCDENSLPVRERLELFATVCQAIQHAHTKGIIHRDIKPTNVLVTRQDGQPVVKVIDFGVAKAMGQQLTEKTLFTEFAQMIGTPLYMSPEQAELSSTDIDTRSDIYSLGVLLYELLTGTTPVSKEQLKQAAFDEIRRIIREDEPQKPSTRISSAESAPSIAAQRHTEPAKLAKLVRGELDWIVMKALEKDRNRRYETASGFARDVQRYLNDEQVQACPPSAWYRFRKFVRRNSQSLAVAALVLIFLVLLGSVAGWAVRDRTAREAEAARHQAARRAKAAGQVESILAEVHGLENEQKWPEALATARRAVALVAGGEADAATAQRVRERLKDLEFIDHLEQIRMQRATIVEGHFDNAGAAREYGRAFRNYGVDALELAAETSIDRLKARPALAIPLAAALDDWVDARRRVTEGDAAGWKPLVAIARGIDPEPLREQLRSAWGRPVSETQDELCRLAESIDIRAQHPATLVSLARTLKRVKHSDSAIRLLQDAQYVYPGDFWLNFELGSALYEQNDQEGAIRFYTAAVSIRPNSAAAHSNLGGALHRQKKLPAAIAAFNKAIEINPNFAIPYSGLGLALHGQKKLDEAIAAFNKAIEIDANFAPAYNGRGGVLADQWKLDEAIAAFNKAIEIDANTSGYHYNLGRALCNQKKFDEAIAALNKAIEIDAKFAPAHYQLGLALDALGQEAEASACYRKAVELDPSACIRIGHDLLDQKKPDEAIACFQKIIEFDPKNAEAYRCLGITLVGHKKPDEAIAWCKKAIELDPKNAQFHYILGDVLRVQNKQDEAIAAYQDGVKLDPKNAQFHFMLGSIFRDQGKLDEAIAAFQETIELDPNNAGFHYNLGFALRLHGKLDEAIAAFQESIRLKPDSAHVHYQLAMALRVQKKLDEAIACYQRAIELEPKSSLFHDGLGGVLYDQQKLDEAVACYQRALELDPHNHGARQRLCGVLENQGKLDEAIALYRQGLAQGPDAGKYYDTYLSRALEQQGKLDEAIAVYREPFRLKPDDAGARNALAWRLNNLAWALATHAELARRDPDRALRLAKEAVELKPEEGRFYNTLGAALYRTGRWNDATENLARSEQLSGGKQFSFIAFFIAMAHWQLGDKDKAREWYDKAVEWMAANAKDNAELIRFRTEAAELLKVELKKELPRGASCVYRVEQ